MLGLCGEGGGGGEGRRGEDAADCQWGKPPSTESSGPRAGFFSPLPRFREMGSFCFSCCFLAFVLCFCFFFHWCVLSFIFLTF